jgi:hypothetical protein
LSEEIRKICSQNDIEFLDLLDPIQATGKNYRDFYFYCDPHWNENGHKLVSDILKKQYLKTPGSP